MKTKSNLRFSLALLSMFLLLNGYAQKDFTSQSAFKYPSTQWRSAFRGPENKVAITDVVSAKVLKRFHKRFKNAERTKWEAVDDNVLATFINEGMTTNSLFDRKGKLIYTVNYCSEKLLPGYVKKMVADNHRNYAITSVAQILQDNRKVWIIKLEGKSDYTAVRIENGEIEEIENFQKVN